jgi:hypothetical protein
MVDYIMKIPACYFTKVRWNTYKFETNRTTKRDLLRRKMLDRFNDAIPTHVGHNYIFDLTTKTSAYMEDQWKKSKFYQNFKDQKAVKDAQPGSIIFKRGCIPSQRTCLDLYMYSLATCYEQCPDHRR